MSRRPQHARSNWRETAKSRSSRVDGPATLPAGENVVVTQALGGTLTVQTDRVNSLGSRPRMPMPWVWPTNCGRSQASPWDPFDYEQVIDRLRTVFDPEIPVNIVDLGLIYACDAHPQADGGYRVEIKMSMTAPGCGMGDVLSEDVRTRVQQFRA